VFLEIADVRDYAKVKVNGKELEAHAWQPYRWDITSAMKAGANDLEIQVYATSSGRGGPGGAPPAAAGAAGGRGGRGGRGQGAPGAAPVYGAAPANRGGASAATSGLLGPVRVVAR
jgi:hypothetical protein